MDISVKFNLDFGGAENPVGDFAKAATMLRIIHRNLEETLFQGLKFILKEEIETGNVHEACSNIRQHASRLMRMGHKNRVEDLTDFLLDEAEAKRNIGGSLMALKLYRAAACVSCLHLKDEKRMGLAVMKAHEIAERAYAKKYTPAAFMGAQIVEDYGAKTSCEPFIPRARKIIHETWPELNRK